MGLGPGGDYCRDGGGRGFLGHEDKIPVDATAKQGQAQKNCTVLRNALQGATQDWGRGGGAVPSLPRRRVTEEDDSEASVALPRGSDQGRRELRCAKVQDQEFVPGDSLSMSETLSSEGSSAEFPLGGSKSSDLMVSEASASSAGSGGGIRTFAKVLPA